MSAPLYSAVLYAVRACTSGVREALLRPGLSRSISLHPALLRTAVIAVVLAAGLGLAVGPAPAQAQADVYVDVSAGGANDGSSWTDAYTSLQEGLSAATSGDVIWVATGTYYPDEGPSVTADARGEAFALEDGVKVFGGFSGSESSLSGRDLSSGKTILSGEIQQDGSASNNAYHVVEAGSGVTSSAALDGVVIKNGTALGPGPKGCGGGLLIQSGNPRLQNLTIKGNEARQGGGLCLAEGAAPEAANVEVTKNTAEYGGGIYAAGSSSGTFTQVTIAGNEATGEGGGVFASGSSPALENAVIWGNATAGTEPSIKNASPTSKSLSLSVTVVGNDLYSGGSYAGSGREPEDGALGQVTVMAGPATYTFDTSTGSASKTIDLPAGTDTAYVRQSDPDFIDTWALNNTDTESAPDLRQNSYTSFPPEPDYQSNYGPGASSAADVAHLPRARLEQSYEARVIPVQSPDNNDTVNPSNPDESYQPLIGDPNLFNGVNRWTNLDGYDEVEIYVQKAEDIAQNEDNVNLQEANSWKDNASKTLTTLLGLDGTGSLIPVPTDTLHLSETDIGNRFMSRNGNNLQRIEYGSKSFGVATEGRFFENTRSSYSKANGIGVTQSEIYSGLTNFDDSSGPNPDKFLLDSDTDTFIEDEVEWVYRVLYSIKSTSQIR